MYPGDVCIDKIESMNNNVPLFHDQSVLMMGCRNGRSLMQYLEVHHSHSRTKLFLEAGIR